MSHSPAPLRGGAAAEHALERPGPKRRLRRRLLLNRGEALGAHRPPVRDRDRVELQVQLVAEVERHSLGSGPPRGEHIAALTFLWLNSIYGSDRT